MKIFIYFYKFRRGDCWLKVVIKNCSKVVWYVILDCGWWGYYIIMGIVLFLNNFRKELGVLVVRGDVVILVFVVSSLWKEM